MNLRASILVVLALAPSAFAGGPAHRRDLTVWLPFWAMPQAYETVIRNADLVAVASPFWYQAYSTHSIAGYAGAGSTSVIAGLRAKDIKVVPTVTSEMTIEEMTALGASAESRAAHAAALVGLASSLDYDGLDLNYENFALTVSSDAARAARASYTALVQDVCAALRAAGKTCVVTVMPMTSDEPAVWRSKLVCQVYDLAAIGTAADRVRVMAYNEHAPNTEPGSIASMPWTVAVTTFSLSKVPAAKLELGIPLYGRDWGGKAVSAVTFPDAQALLLKYRPSRKRDRTGSEPYFSYREKGRTHTVWYNDAASAAARYRLVKRYKLAGAALWAASQEDPALWDRLRGRARPLSGL